MKMQERLRVKIKNNKAMKYLIVILILLLYRVMHSNEIDYYLSGKCVIDKDTLTAELDIYFKSENPILIPISHWRFSSDSVWCENVDYDKVFIYPTLVLQVSNCPHLITNIDYTINFEEFNIPYFIRLENGKFYHFKFIYPLNGEKLTSEFESYFFSFILPYSDSYDVFEYFNFLEKNYWDYVIPTNTFTIDFKNNGPYDTYIYKYSDDKLNEKDSYIFNMLFNKQIIYRCNPVILDNNAK